MLKRVSCRHSRILPPLREFGVEVPESFSPQASHRRVIMKRYLLAMGVLLFAGVAARPALADSFFLIGTNDMTGAPCSVASPCAEVTITTLGNTATFTVSSLDNHYVFDTFGFNFTGTGSLSLTGSGGEVSSPSLGGSGNEDGWGKFDFNFNTGKSGGSSGSDCTVTMGSPSAGCTFTFTVTDSLPGSLTPSEFEELSAGGTGSGDFAGHIATSNGSGYIGDSAPLNIGSVPEPSSLMLLGTGALALAGVVRRRFGR